MHRLLALALLPGCLAFYEPCDTVDEGQGENQLLGGSTFDSLTCWADGDDEDPWRQSGLAFDEGSPGSGAPVYYADNSQDGSDSWAVQLMQGDDRTIRRRSSLGLEADDHYEVRFWAKADPPRSMYVHMTDEDDSWTFEEVVISAEWAQYVVAGQIVGGSPDEAFLDLQMGGQAGTIYLDDVELQDME